MAAQQHQLLQAANAQHMAAMVALEAMQNQAKVGYSILKSYIPHMISAIPYRPYRMVHTSLQFTKKLQIYIQ